MAMPGPNVRKRPTRATRRARLPAATVRPATSTMGANSSVLDLAASSRSSPETSRSFNTDRKKIE